MHASMQNKPAELMQKANPLLFSCSEEYPLDYEDLKRFLATNADPAGRDVRPLTYVNYVDMLLYQKNGQVDVDRKLACEFALYQVQRAQRLGRLTSGPGVPWEKLVQLEPFTKPWYESLIVLLESINATNVEGTWPAQPGHLNRTDLQADPSRAHDEAQLQELTSYVLSRAVQEDIDLKPVHMDEPVEFLKAAFNTVLESARKDPATQQNDDDAGLQTAVQDLQLANNFLTKQFENDHADYVQNIEKLQRTNKELQQKVLDYHSMLVKTEGTKVEVPKTESFKATKSRESGIQDASKVPQSNFQYTSPLMTGDLWLPGSPLSATSDNSVSSTSQSINVMRAEFKRMLTQTQRKYEKELQQERDAKTRLEQELNKYKDFEKI